MTHMLKEAVGKDVTARCGHVEQRKGAGLPASFTGWESEVTCEGCRL